MVTLEALPPVPPMGVDYRDEVPDIRLFPDERVYPKPYKVEIPPPRRYLTPREAICALTGVNRFEDVGKVRPSKAALPAPGNEEVGELNIFSADGNLFGRDSLIVAQDVFPLAPLLLRITLLELARDQGITDHVLREEEPGKILHERRLPGDSIGIQITKDFGWEWPYYGSVDSTEEWLIGMNRYCLESTEGFRFLGEKVEGRDKKEHTMAEAYAKALGWTLGKLGNGKVERLLEYRPGFSGSLVNQNWTDSPDSAHHKNGKLANPKLGVATVELQGLAFDALVGAADLYEKGDELRRKYPQPNLEHPDDLRQRAEDLKRMTIGMLWMGDHFALGYDRDDLGSPRVMDIWRSNMGHLLNSRMLDDEPEISAQLVQALFSPKMINNYGIRTLAENEVRYGAGFYHNGSRWPHDNEKTAKGLRRHKLYGLSGWIRMGNLDTFATFQKYLEFTRGDMGPVRLNDRVVKIWDSTYNRYYTAEQPPQENQAWAASAALAAEHDFSQDLARQQKGLPFVRSEQIRFLDKQVLESLPQRPAA